MGKAIEEKIITEPTLVILAAGMGSRFGGCKQVASIGPSGERIIDYSAYDAVLAGFKNIVFVITEQMKKDFEEAVGYNISKSAKVSYCFQRLDDLPAGYQLPSGREKPWGTGHAVLAAKELVKGPFAVINADDFYGRESFKILYDFLAKPRLSSNGKTHIAMVGYQLSKTMTENGSVSRGVCDVCESGYLKRITERTEILWKNGIPAFTEDDGESYESLCEDTLVSMNCWGFPAGVMSSFEDLFSEFIKANIDAPRAEFYLPGAVDSMIQKGDAEVSVIPTSGRWYGMTYAEDKNFVADAINSLVKNGEYPEKLW